MTKKSKDKKSLSPNKTKKFPVARTATGGVAKNEVKLFEFRRYKKVEGGKNNKARHPKLIVEKKKDELGFMGLTEAEKSGHHKNIELTKNPKKGDSRPAYVRKEVRYDSRENFSEVLKNYNLTKEDKKTIIEYLEKRKEKRKKKEVTHVGSH